VLEESLILTIDANYFRLTGGIERWLYRLVRKHGGWQREGWRFDFPHLHRKSGSLARFTDFAYDLRRIVARQPLPGYTLAVLRPTHGPEVLAFRAVPSTAPMRPGGSFGAGAVPVEKR
jgi:plasmid replication initiation protein